MGLGLSLGEISNEAGQMSVRHRKKTSSTLAYFGCSIKGIVHREMSSFIHLCDDFLNLAFCLLGVEHKKCSTHTIKINVH